MKCGERSSVIINKTFAWYPPWIGVLTVIGALFFLPLALIFGILGAVLTKRMNVRIPLCDKHKGHWTMRTLIILLGLLVILAFVGLAIYVSVSEKRDLADMAVLFWALAGLAFVAWIIVIAVLQQTAIRPTLITDRSITLICVSRGYIEALRADRGDDYDDDRRRKRPRDDDYDDDRPRKRRALPENEEDDAPRPKARDKSDGIVDPEKPKRRQEDSEAIQGGDE
jgi:hypothetical protein